MGTRTGRGGRNPITRWTIVRNRRAHAKTTVGNLEGERGEPRSGQGATIERAWNEPTKWRPWCLETPRTLGGPPRWARLTIQRHAWRASAGLVAEPCDRAVALIVFVPAMSLARGPARPDDREP